MSDSWGRQNDAFDFSSFENEQEKISRLSFAGVPLSAPGSTTSPSSAPSNGALNSQNPAESDAEETPTNTGVEPYEEDEESPLVALSNAVFLDPDNARVGEKAHVEVTVNYLTERTPKTIEFRVKSVFEQDERFGTTVNAEVNEGKATAELELPQNNDFYHKENKSPEDKVTYSFIAKCPVDGTETESDSVLLPQNSLSIDLIEVIDNSFLHNSAAATLDEEGNLVESIAALFQHLEKYPDKEVLILGHTDTSGDDDSNFELSKKRAMAIKAIISKDKDLWNSAIKNAYSAWDYQTTLKSFVTLRGWSCDPGIVDGIDGSQTKEGLKSFQSTYNSIYNGSLDEDGLIGPMTWGAICHTFYELALETSGLTEDDFFVQFYSRFDGTYPCGEAFPIEKTGVDGLRSSTNRRVEIICSERPNPPQLPEPKPKPDLEEDDTLDIYDKDNTDVILPPKPEMEPEGDCVPFILAYLPMEKDPSKAFTIIPYKDFETACQSMKEFGDELQKCRDDRDKLVNENCTDTKKIEASKKKYAELLKNVEGKPSFVELIALNKFKDKGKLYKTQSASIKRLPIEFFKGDYKKFSAQEAEAAFEQEVKDAGLKNKKLKNYVQPKVKSTWLKTPDTWNWQPENWRIGSSTDAFKDNDYVDGGYDVAFMRAAAAGEIGIEADLAQMSLNVGVKGNASFSLAEGKCNLNLSLPNKNGFDLIKALHKYLDDQYIEEGTYDANKSKFFVKPNSHCFLLLKFEIAAYGFIGANIAVSLPELNLNLKKSDTQPGEITQNNEKKPIAKLEAKADAFAGTSGTIELTAALDWKAGKPTDKFATVSKGGGNLTGRAGIGGKLQAGFSMDNGKVKIELAANLVVGLGGGGAIIFELDINEAFKMISKILRSFNYHNTIHIAPQLLKLYFEVQLAVLTGYTNVVADIAQGLYNAARDWIASWFDDSSQNKRNKLILDNKDLLRSAPPEVLGEIVGRLLEDYHDGDCKRILDILEQSTEGVSGGKNHEMAWIVRYANIEDGFFFDTTPKDIIVDKAKYLKEGKEKLLEFFEDDATDEELSKLEKLLQQC